MHKVILALVMVLLALCCKKELEDWAKKKLDKEFKELKENEKTSFTKPPIEMAKDIEKVIASSVPSLYIEHKEAIQSGVIKIAEAAHNNKLVHIKMDMDRKRFFS